MKIVLLSGGSGKRLWPLSNEIRSKQFLKIVKSENGKIESMLQRVYRQIKSAGIDAEIAIATRETQVEAIKNQLGDKVLIVVEPESRNTFPAIMLLAAYLHYELKCHDNETVVVLPIDPYVGDNYFQTLKKLDDAVQKNIADIVLMGVVPTYPSEKYGYIIPANDDKNIVRSFREKPPVADAEKLIVEGAFWNCGVVAAKLSFLFKILESTIKCNSYLEVLEKYSQMEKNSFDYVVLEKAKSVGVVPYDGEWKDLGTWNTLTEVMDAFPIGDVKMSRDCVNTHVVNELEIPIVVMGARDMVVAASPDGILVADKVQSSFIKKYVEDLNVRPMFEERAWGEYTVLNVAVDELGNKAVTKKKCIRAGNVIEEMAHKKHSEVWTILSGRAVININGRNHDALPGDTYTIPRNTLHSLKAVENTSIIEIQISG